MTQLELPRSTSRKAYREIVKEGKLGEMQKNALYQISTYGPMTAQELQESCPYWPGIWKRLSELRNLGLIEECGKRRCSVTGKTAIVWRVK